MKLMKCCGHICVVLNMVVLNQYLAIAPRTFPVDTHEVSELLGVYLCSFGYGGSKTKIWH